LYIVYPYIFKLFLICYSVHFLSVTVLFLACLCDRHLDMDIFVLGMEPRRVFFNHKCDHLFLQKIYRSGEEKGRALKLNKERRLAQVR
jgi:hypothetical protein